MLMFKCLLRCSSVRMCELSNCRLPGVASDCGCVGFAQLKVEGCWGRVAGASYNPKYLMALGALSAPSGENSSQGLEPDSVKWVQ